jgi:hypothetical protein
MNYVLKRCERHLSWPNLRYYPDIRVERLKKTTKYLREDSWFRGQYLNPKPPEYKEGLLTTRPLRSNEVSPDQDTSLFEVRGFMSEPAIGRTLCVFSFNSIP